MSGKSAESQLIILLQLNKILFMKKAILILVLGSLVLLPSLVYSQGFKSANTLFQKVGQGAGADTYSEVQNIVGIGLNAALSLVGLIFLILMVYAGYLWMTARGEEEQIKKAQKIITSSIIGLIITVGAYSITAFVVPQILERTVEGAPTENVVQP